MLGTVGSRVARSVGVGRAAPARVLPGDLLRPSGLCGLGLGVSLVILGFGLTLAHLPRSAWCDRGRGSDCPRTGNGVQGAPLSLYTDREEERAPADPNREGKAKSRWTVASLPRYTKRRPGQHVL